MELRLLLDDLKAKSEQYDTIMEVVEQICAKLPEIAVITGIKGVGIVTAAGLVAEIGDIRRFDSPRQIQKLAGYAIRENSSGKHKGQTGISKRGRKRLRAILFRAAIVLVVHNHEFRELHHYFTRRAENPLKKKQSIVAVSCKLIRVIFALVSKDRRYDPERMLADIHRNMLPKAA
jgi:transposase